MDKATTDWLNSNLNAADAKVCIPLFTEQSINTLNDIKQLTKDDLVELKLDIGTRNRVLTVFEKLKEPQPQPQPQPKALPPLPAANSFVRCSKGHGMTQHTGRLPASYAADAKINCDGCGAQAFDIKSDYYHCVRCDDYDFCAACSLKKIRAWNSKPNPHSWKCMACTFQNESHARRCLMCAVDRVVNLTLPTPPKASPHSILAGLEPRARIASGPTPESMPTPNLLSGVSMPESMPKSIPTPESKPTPKSMPTPNLLTLESMPPPATAS